MSAKKVNKPLRVRRTSSAAVVITDLLALIMLALVVVVLAVLPIYNFKVDGTLTTMNYLQYISSAYNVAVGQEVAAPIKAFIETFTGTMVASVLPGLKVGFNVFSPFAFAIPLAIFTLALLIPSIVESIKGTSHTGSFIFAFIVISCLGVTCMMIEPMLFVVTSLLFKKPSGFTGPTIEFNWIVPSAVLALTVIILIVAIILHCTCIKNTISERHLKLLVKEAKEREEKTVPSPLEEENVEEGEAVKETELPMGAAVMADTTTEPVVNEPVIETQTEDVAPEVSEQPEVEEAPVEQAPTEVATETEVEEAKIHVSSAPEGECLMSDEEVEARLIDGATHVIRRIIRIAPKEKIAPKVLARPVNGPAMIKPVEKKPAVYKPAEVKRTATVVNKPVAVVKPAEVKVDTKPIIEKTPVEVKPVEEVKPVVVEKPVDPKTVLPEGLTEIPAYRFTNNKNLKVVTIPLEVTTLGDSCFANCANIKELNIHKGVTKIASKAFYKCPKLVTINYDGTREEFKLIQRGGGWLASCGTRVINCEDGEIAVNPYK